MILTRGGSRALPWRHFCRAFRRRSPDSAGLNRVPVALRSLAALQIGAQFRGQPQGPGFFGRRPLGFDLKPAFRPDRGSIRLFGLVSRHVVKPSHLALMIMSETYGESRFASTKRRGAGQTTTPQPGRG